MSFSVFSTESDGPPSLDEISISTQKSTFRQCLHPEHRLLVAVESVKPLEFWALPLGFRQQDQLQPWCGYDGIHSRQFSRFPCLKILILLRFRSCISPLFFDAQRF